jgi:hypothetical protein
MEPPEPDADLEAIADRLHRERPVPRAAFRAELRSRLLAARGGRPRPTRSGIRVLIGAYAGSGIVLLLIATLGVTGSGPLAP